MKTITATVTAHRKRRILALLCASALALDAGVAIGAPASTPAEDALAAGFAEPPNAAKPRIWWHWMAGNISAEGARLDLDWMRRIGIGGVHAFSGGKLPEPIVVPKPVAFMTPEWKAIFRQSLEQAREAGLELGIAGSPGWSETGGPWVTPADAMKKYVWSETLVEGGRPMTLALPAPPKVAGAFQGAKTGKSSLEAYGDAAVFAYLTPGQEVSPPPAQWTTAAGPITLAETVAGVPTEGLTLKLIPEAGGKEAWLVASFAKPVTLGAVSLGVQNGAIVTLEAEQAPSVFKPLGQGIIDATTGPLAHGAPQETLAFAPTTTQRLRLRFSPLPDTPLPPVAKLAPPPGKTGYAITRLALHSGARINGFEAKAGFEPSIHEDVATTPDAPAGTVIDPAKVVDLTGKLRPDGTLDWTPPKGRWTIVRLGWSLTGAVNAPAEPSATGLEVDKLDAAAVGRYLDHYLGLYDDASGGALGPKGVQTLLTDSWEAGVQNWTPAMLAEFRARRGYDPAPWLPILTGRVVQSAQASERFLFDYRQTLKDLVIDNHYGVIAKATKARSMGYYTEVQGDYPRAIADGMTAKARADIPTAEFWYRNFSTQPGQPPLKADLQEAASAAHVYGKPLVAAESLTVAAMFDPWSFSPAMMKPVADEIFARGVNRILLHESHMQPLVDAKPGLGLFIFGQYLNRNETWAEQAAPWVSYLARTSYLLQQGHYVADVAYFYGEERNLTERFKDEINTAIPAGHGYDYVNPEALLTLLSVRDGQLVTPSGMAYRVLYLPDDVTRFTLPALRKIGELVHAGAVLVAKRPTGGLGLSSPDAEVAKLADAIWGDGAAGHRYGQGRVYGDLAAALAAEKITPDVAFEEAAAPGDLLTLHRRAGDADIYFISNQSAQAQSVSATFRVEGRIPELWRAETGQSEAISYEQVEGGVRAPLALAPHEAVFVVMRKPAQAKAWTAPAVQRQTLATLDARWRVSFEKGRGAPETASFDKLISWPDSADPGIKYFSGVGTYAQDVTVKKAWLKPGQRVELDLGEVRELATVSVNGKAVVTAWHAPYRVDLTDALKPGKNTVTIAVTNLWPNRLIGDKQPGAKAVAFAPGSTYSAKSPLLPSGLLGPVRLVGETHGPTTSSK
ncbi:glycosyl hydrolase [Caulobacter sp. BK020]|uniref:glycosyl hydrolase n=1 Tax=Caulobacter sp. BK020 TaxID=2512117 RepID=UPI0010518C99|nr:glycosyl hydrolase [Caulobacter sp. BK020]TCS14942.1 glycosyl hydrolase family 2 [Caulobacter sp. BK020]